MLKQSVEYCPEYLFRGIRETIQQRYPAFIPFYAFFGCSDEVNTATDMIRSNIFGGYGGIFTTRVIGSQIFYQQLKVALSRGHRSNIFEVNVHIGEISENGKPVRGVLIGRDGQKRGTCGALCHIIDDFRTKPDEVPSISQTEDGILHLDFLGAIKYRLHMKKTEILNSPNPVETITRINLKAQIDQLISFLKKLIADTAAIPPLFVIGTVSYNRNEMPDTESLEYFYLLTGKDSEQDLLS